MSSLFENPQMDPRPEIGANPPIPASITTSETAYLPPVAPPAAPRDPVWSGWDVLLLALLTLITLIAAEFLTTLGAKAFFFPHSSFRDLMQKPSLDVIGEFLGYIAVAAYMIMLVEGKY